MSDPIRIENWSTTVPASEAYRPPEARGTYLQGDVGPGAHPRHPRGGRLLTSRIVRVDGRLVWTQGGRCYVLGQVDPKFVEWLAANGKALDERQPITMLAGGQPIP